MVLALLLEGVDVLPTKLVDLLNILLLTDDGAALGSYHLLVRVHQLIQFLMESGHETPRAESGSLPLSTWNSVSLDSCRHG